MSRQRRRSVQAAHDPVSTREADLRRVELRPEDWVSAVVHLDNALRDDDIASLRGKALLDWYRENEPDAILTEAGARRQALDDEMRDCREV
jgi:hypothetical protein